MHEQHDVQRPVPATQTVGQAAKNIKWRGGTPEEMARAIAEQTGISYAEALANVQEVVAEKPKLVAGFADNRGAQHAHQPLAPGEIAGARPPLNTRGAETRQARRERERRERKALAQANRAIDRVKM